MKWTRRALLSSTAAVTAAAATRPVFAAGEEPPPLPPPLPSDTYRERQERLRAAAKAAGADALFLTPSTNLGWSSGLSIGRSERLTALLLPVDGPSVLVTPAFEVSNHRRAAADEILGWEEDADPWALVSKALGSRKVIGVEPTTAFETVTRLGAAVPAKLESAGGIFQPLRMVKSEAEQALIKDAGRRTSLAIDRTHKRLRRGMSESEVSRILEEEHGKLLVNGGGLVQFGPSAALPHGGPGDRRLEKGQVVLIDAGCRVRGYTSDVTRTICFGPPSDEIRKVYAAVDRAQLAGITALKAGATGEEVDGAARRVLEEAGYGSAFTHRLGHGLGLDGHEEPYLVRGNRKPLVAGNTVTVEPGVYLPERFGVRIEDDYAVREGATPASLSVRPSELVVIGG